MHSPCTVVRSHLLSQVISAALTAHPGAQTPPFRTSAHAIVFQVQHDVLFLRRVWLCFPTHVVLPPCPRARTPLPRGPSPRRHGRHPSRRGLASPCFPQRVARHRPPQHLIHRRSENITRQEAMSRTRRIARITYSNSRRRAPSAGFGPAQRFKRRSCVKLAHSFEGMLEALRPENPS